MLTQYYRADSISWSDLEQKIHETNKLWAREALQDLYISTISSPTLWGLVEDEFPNEELADKACSKYYYKLTKEAEESDNPLIKDFDLTSTIMMFKYKSAIYVKLTTSPKLKSLPDIIGKEKYLHKVNMTYPGKGTENGVRYESPVWVFLFHRNFNEADPANI